MSSSSDTLVVSQPKLFDLVGFAPHPGQAAVLEDPARFQVVAAGRRFGKSEIGGHVLLTEAMKAYYRRAQLEDTGKRAEFWIVGPEYSDAEKEFRVLWNEVSKLEMPLDRPGSYNDVIGGSMHISLWGGRFQVHAKSAKHPETLVGEGLHGAVLAEAAKLKERVWTKYVRPTLNDFGGWAKLTSTPEGKNWFYERWQAGQDPNNPAWKSWRMPSWSNPYVYKHSTTDEGIIALREKLERGEVILTPENCIALGVDPEIGQLVSDLSQPMFNQEIGALFTEFVGRVFQDFDEETHVGNLKFNPEWKTYACCDYGFTNPSVWLLLQIDPFGEKINILAEVYERGLTIDEFADRIIHAGLAPDNCLAFYPDPSSPGDSKFLSDRLRVPSKGGTGGEIKHRLEMIRQWLRPLYPHHPDDHPEQRPKLMVDRSCTNTVREFLDYRYPDKRDQQDKNAPENPLKKDDHAPEALGRFFAGYFGGPGKQVRRTRVHTASMTGR